MMEENILAVHTTRRSVIKTAQPPFSTALGKNKTPGPTLALRMHLKWSVLNFGGEFQE
jgi:hypothetical protein